MICGIQGEINFSQRGWKEVIEDGSNNTYHRAMNYIEVPLLAHLAFGKDKGNGARFIINLGPQVGFLLGEKNITVTLLPGIPLTVRKELMNNTESLPTGNLTTEL